MCFFKNFKNKQIKRSPLCYCLNPTVSHLKQKEIAEDKQQQKSLKEIKIKNKQNLSFLFFLAAKTGGYDSR